MTPFRFALFTVLFAVLTCEVACLSYIAGFLLGPT